MVPRHYVINYFETRQDFRYGITDHRKVPQASQHGNMRTRNSTLHGIRLRDPVKRQTKAVCILHVVVTLISIHNRSQLRIFAGQCRTCRVMSTNPPIHERVEEKLGFRGPVHCPPLKLGAYDKIYKYN